MEKTILKKLRRLGIYAYLDIYKSLPVKLEGEISQFAGLYLTLGQTINLLIGECACEEDKTRVIEAFKPWLLRDSLKDRTFVTNDKLLGECRQHMVDSARVLKALKERSRMGHDQWHEFYCHIVKVINRRDMAMDVPGAYRWEAKGEARWKEMKRAREEEAAEALREADRLRETCTPQEMAEKCYGGLIKRQSLNSKELEHLNKFEKEEERIKREQAIREAEERRKKAVREAERRRKKAEKQKRERERREERREEKIRSDLKHLRKTRPEEFFNQYLDNPEWERYIKLTESGHRRLERVKEIRKLAISAEEVQSRLGVSGSAIQLWTMAGFLPVIRIKGAVRYNPEKLPTPRALKGKQLPETVPCDREIRQADILARGWTKDKVDSIIGSPDRVGSWKYGKVYYFSLYRVLRHEVEEEGKREALAERFRRKGIEIPDELRYASDIIQHVINKHPKLYKLPAMLTRGGWKVRKKYKIGSVTFVKSASILAKKIPTTEKEVQGLKGEMREAARQQKSTWDERYKKSKEQVAGYKKSGLHADILGMALASIPSDSWLEEQTEETVSEQIIKASISHVLGLSNFHTTFDRPDNRKLKAILGPTNSGKTHRAFQSLLEAKTGIYLAPLRLMAAEGWDKLNQRGIGCSLLTGEEQKVRLGDTHISATVEMLPHDREFDVAVIDEVQMLGDRDRGWAWANAILGVKAKIVYLVGAPESETLLKTLARQTAEDLDITYTERLAPLEVTSAPVMGSPEGSAIISFSRRGVLETKEHIGGHCGVIYGALSPEVRREEAKRFACGQSRCIAATDAIGMGLNLPIKTVIFTTVEKWDGEKERLLTPLEVRQISGRAGRFGKHEVGYVSARTQADLEYIGACLEGEIDQLPPKVQIGPHVKMLEYIKSQTGIHSLCGLLDIFLNLPMKRTIYRKASIESMVRLADLIGGGGEMSIRDQFALCCCPIDIKSDEQVSQWWSWAASVNNRERARLPRIPSVIPATNSGLAEAEMTVSLLNAYKWLHYKFPAQFTEIGRAETHIANLSSQILKILKGRIHRSCRKCGCILPKHHYHANCDPCYFRARREYCDW